MLRLTLCCCAFLLIAADPAPDWVRVTDRASWRPRDSSGEVVFDNKLWLLGGWFDSYSPPPRDVWSSPDGKAWKLVTKEAPWKYSDLPMTVVFKDRMWLMGGWTNGRLPGHGATNEVWSSADGASWKREADAGWSPRLAAGAVVFKGRMWILGGTENYYFGDEKSLRNDVWSSADGRTWRLETKAAPWSPRAYHAALAHDGKLWVFGGGNYVPKYHALNDVWCSSDGVTWERATGSAPWPPRIWFSAVTYRDRMWVLGGWSNDPKARNWGDVWHSRDGKAWAQLKTPTCWKDRHEHSAYVFQDRVWVAGGHAQPLSSEVWSLHLPKGWLKD